MKIDTTTIGYKALNKNYEQVIVNTQGDKLLSESYKEDFFKNLNNYKSHIDIESFCEEFYRMKNDFTRTDGDLENLKYKFLGKIDSNSDTIFYGHVEAYKTFQKNLALALSIDNNEVDDILNKLVKSDEKALASFFKASRILDLKIRQVPLWSFKSLSINDSAFNLLQDVLGHLPGILGLDSDYKSKDWIAFGYCIPTSIETKKPTAFDAELHIYWRPGGFTLNICKTEDKKKYSSGLEEIVSYPIYYKNINSKLYKL